MTQAVDRTTPAQDDQNALKPMWREPAIRIASSNESTQLNFTPGIDSLFEGSLSSTGAS